MSSNGEFGSKGCATRARANNDILVVLESSGCGGVVERTLNVCAAKGCVVCPVTGIQVKECVLAKGMELAYI